MSFHKEIYADCDICGKRIKQGAHVHCVGLSYGHVGLDDCVFGNGSVYYSKHVCGECAAATQKMLDDWQRQSRANIGFTAVSAEPPT
jgi:hypothetical protein